jgi:hypothetical protein
MEQPRSYNVITLSLTCLAALAMLLGYKSFSLATNAMKDAFSTTDKITQTFRSNIEKVISTHGNVLELATSESGESFRMDSERRAFGGRFYLGTTSSEIEARCTFRYHLKLSDEWVIEVKSNSCIVHAPAFRASLPVAIHTDTMRKHAESGWARFDKQEQLDALESGMTGDLAKRAEKSDHRDAVREECRKSVADFVQTWLMREDHWRQDRFTSIMVQFPDDGSLFFSRGGSQEPVIRLRE